MKTVRRKFFRFILTATLISCAGAPASKFGHHQDHPYKPTDFVNPAGEDEYSRSADRDAFAALRDMSSIPGLLFGAIGATVQLVRANSAMNTTYERSLKACLRDRGYTIPA